MSPENNERIADGLPKRGFDAHTFIITSDRYCRRESGVAIHGVCVLGWRYPDGRWEFVDRPARLVEPDERDPAQRWIWEEITSSSGARQQLSLIVTDQPDVVCARLAELLPVDPRNRTPDASQICGPGNARVGSAEGHPTSGTRPGVNTCVCRWRGVGPASPGRPIGTESGDE